MQNIPQPLLMLKHGLMPLATDKPTAWPSGTTWSISRCYLSQRQLDNYVLYAMHGSLYVCLTPLVAINTN